MTAARAAACAFVGVLIAGLSLGACVTVHPWERGALAHRCIQWAASPDANAARQHVLTVREAAQGGHGASTGGCGCD